MHSAVHTTSALDSLIIPQNYKYTPLDGGFFFHPDWLPGAAGAAEMVVGMKLFLTKYIKVLPATERHRRHFDHVNLLSLHVSNWFILNNAAGI